MIAGLAVLSFNTATREQMPTLQPPDQAAYLSNIAVDPQYRRYGRTRPTVESPRCRFVLLPDYCCADTFLLQARHCISSIEDV